jgi:hypothetical protein
MAGIGGGAHPFSRLPLAARDAASKGQADFARHAM